MKKTTTISIMSICALAILIFSACNERKSKSYDDYRGYVITRVDSPDRYYDTEWDELERDYIAKKDKVEADVNNMSEEAKAEYRDLDTRWNEFKASYNDRRAKREMEKFQAILVPSDVSADFSNVTAERLLPVYTYFVDYVDNHKDDFTREQWGQVELVYERLDTRKNEVEKDLPKGDNTKIAAQKVRYSAIKTVNRPGTKPEENEEAKEQAEMK
jgi:hypothetical protein